MTRKRAAKISAELFEPATVEMPVRAGDVHLVQPTDVLSSLRSLAGNNVRAAVVMLDPWYNKGVGGVRPDYDEYIIELLTAAGQVGNHVFLWGFPEIVARFVREIPAPLSLTAWLTWYYKNNPSVIRGWRSAQMTCLHLSRPGARMYPEHFLNEAQHRLRAAGKLRYMPGPTSVIEASLLVGFVGRAEQTGHPSQKPIAAIAPLLKMTTKPGDLVIDPMCGSGTTGAVARVLGVTSILGDVSEEYTQMVERRLDVTRITDILAPATPWIDTGVAAAA